MIFKNPPQRGRHGGQVAGEVEERADGRLGGRLLCRLAHSRHDIADRPGERHVEGLARSCHLFFFEAENLKIGFWLGRRDGVQCVQSAFQR